MTRVFISYSHDSDAHRDFVRGLSDRLRTDGLECLIDQYINGFPPEGWQCWMENQIEAADFVLLVCTETYLRRYRKQETEGGRGVTFEGVVISQVLYDHYYHNTKFIPVVPQQGKPEHVPIPLKQYSTYRLPEDYETLYRLLTNQAQFLPTPLGEIRPPSLLSRWFGGKKPAPTSAANTAIAVYDQRFPVTDNNAMVGREQMLAQLNQYWEQHSVRVVVLQAWGGVGKTALVNLWREHLRLAADTAYAPQRIYCWSFQNQGSERAQTSSGQFFSHALAWFGAEQQKFSSEYDKGVYLAKLINTQRSLLVLDGLEVFQPWNSVQELKHQLNDLALLGLLKTLAQVNLGLCVITTRQALDKRLLEHGGVVERQLSNLPMQAAVQLLQNAGIKGKAAQLEPVVKQYQRHAYSLVLLASYLKTYAQGDIRRLDTLPPLLDDDSEANWQGRQIMFAYADALNGKEELGLLYVVSVFEQAVERGLILELIRALKAGGYQTALNKLTLTRLDEPQRWAACCGRLCKQGLLLGNSDEWLDLHPLVRDFFRREFVQRHGGIKRIIHLELYAYYKALPEKELPDTLEEMQPLFSAVAHGCAAGLHQQALHEIYWPRIQRSGQVYICNNLGAFSDDLATVAHFFTTPWHTPVAGLQEMWQAGVVQGWAGFSLRALGRLREALEPMQANIEMSVQQENWIEAAKGASNLSELQLTLGDVAQAVESGARSSRYADQSGDMFHRMSKRTTHADALHQAGDTAVALALFREAEQLQQEREPEFPRLYSLQGFRYCDLLLTQGSTAEVLERAEYDLDCWTNHFSNGSLLDFSLPKLTIGCAHLQQLLLPSTSGRGAGGEGLHWLEQAVAGLRASGYQQMMPLGLLARAALHRHTRDFARARQDLQEVFDIADGSGMRLHLTDYHLEMARLLVAEAKTLTPTPLPEVEGLQEHISKAAKLIEETGYHRRDPELAALQGLAHDR
ncbi:SEFIR domain-containing protein [Thiothrix caldifontis]|uniref:SEFIR domain-containing protein n=1 Tax=Thiothrix caldifontis TaxID=525918 RepID=A0A1H3VJ19_9GAMM|nr:SEFIR domain-containing protein [Thiothrix caldifontis]SDZ74769.1 SEFIR domain-containing protein [Thiothrix caldifontis]